MNKDFDEMLDPRYSLCKQKAKDILCLIDNKIPIVLNDIIKIFGIKIRKDNLTSCFGMSSISSDGIITIQYKENMSIARSRFTVAHEIGHIALEHISIDGNTSSLYSHKSQEKEANCFAGELLVPSGDLKNFCKKNNPTIKEISNRYNVSDEVSTICITNNRMLKYIKIDQ